MEFLEKYPWAAAGLAVLLIMLALALLLARREARQRARLMGRLRHDSEQQAQALIRMGESLNAALGQVEALSGNMEARQERLRRTLDERMELMSQANERRLEQMRETVSEKLEGRLNESFRAVNGQLAGVHKGLGEMRALALGVTDLKKMLGGVKTRGIWGEVQLRSLMRQMFAPGQYVENAAIPAGSQTRVEFALILPGAEGSSALLPIDSKFPQEDYLRLMEASAAGDANLAEKCASQLERAVLEQAKMISGKYIKPPETADFAVMFLPTESLYAEVARRNGLIETIQSRHRVLVAGPATLCALLASLQMGLRSCALEKRSGEALKQLSGLRQDFNQFGESVQRMRTRLNQAQGELDGLEARAGKLGRALDRLDGD